MVQIAPLPLVLLIGGAFALGCIFTLIAFYVILKPVYDKKKK